MKQTAKKVVVLLLMFFLLHVLVACEQNDSQLEEPDTEGNTEQKQGPAEDREKSVGGCAIDTSAEERGERDRELFQEAVRSLGAEVKILAAQADGALRIS